jgi:hypothetical protein
MLHWTFCHILLPRNLRSIWAWLSFFIGEISGKSKPVSIPGRIATTGEQATRGPALYLAVRVPGTEEAVAPIVR